MTDDYLTAIYSDIENTQNELGLLKVHLKKL